MKSYQFSICDVKLPLGGISTVALAGALGYDGTYFKDFGGAKKNYPLNQPWIIDRFRQALETTGTAIETVQVASAVDAGQLLCTPDSAEGKAGLAAVKNCAAFCKAVGAARILLESFGASALKTREDLINTAAFMKESAKIAADAGLVLSYEPFSPIDTVLELYEKSGERFTLCYDTANPYVYGFGDALDELPRYFAVDGFISHIHFKDAPASLQGNVPLGEGVCHYEDCVRLIKQHGYTGWILTENNYAAANLGGADFTKALAADLATLRRDFC